MLKYRSLTETNSSLFSTLLQKQTVVCLALYLNEILRLNLVNLQTVQKNLITTRIHTFIKQSTEYSTTNGKRCGSFSILLFISFCNYICEYKTLF